MKIFLQPLLPETGYEPFATVVQALGGDKAQVLATVWASQVSDVACGQSVVALDSGVAYSNVPTSFGAAIGEHLMQVLQSQVSVSRVVTTAAGEAQVMYSVLTPAPAIIVLGAGLDAKPVVRFAQELGWRVTVQDHRPAYIESGNFSGVEELLCVPVNEVSATLDLNRYAAAIVMSHHLVSDRDYLLQLAASCVSYVGLLGPVGRRDRLLKEIGSAAEKLTQRLHSPAGIDIGGRGPAAIALSIVAEMHQELLRPRSD